MNFITKTFFTEYGTGKFSQYVRKKLHGPYRVNVSLMLKFSTTNVHTQIALNCTLGNLEEH